MNKNIVLSLFVLAGIAGIVAAAGWYQSRGQLRELRLSELAPIAASLKEDEELLKALQPDSALDKNSGILRAYLAAIRADGVASDFKSEADRFQHYAIAWRDRWNSVMELFMAGGNYRSEGILERGAGRDGSGAARSLSRDPLFPQRSDR